MGVGAGLDHVTLVDLLVEERGEGVPARAERIDLTHEREYRKSGFALIGRFAAGGLEDEHFAADVGGDVGLGRKARTVRPVAPSTASVKRDSIARWKACRESRTAWSSPASTNPTERRL